jgi:hypothetical protein
MTPRGYQVIDELAEPPAPPRHLTPAEVADVVPGLDVSTDELRVHDITEVLGRPRQSGTARPDGAWAKWETPSGCTLKIEYTHSTGQVGKGVLYIASWSNPPSPDDPVDVRW